MSAKKKEVVEEAKAVVEEAAADGGISADEATEIKAAIDEVAAADATTGSFTDVEAQVDGSMDDPEPVVEEVVEPVVEAAPIVEEVTTVDPATLEKMLEAPAETVADAPVLDVDGLTYGIVCTECGRFIPDPMGEKIVGRCNGCGGKVTYGLKKDVKTIVNQTRKSQGLSPMF